MCKPFVLCVDGDLAGGFTGPLASSINKQLSGKVLSLSGKVLLLLGKVMLLSGKVLSLAICSCLGAVPTMPNNLAGHIYIFFCIVQCLLSDLRPFG